MPTLTLPWAGPFTFQSGQGQSLLQAPEGEARGIYVWGVPTPHGLLPHYVGETGTSFARRHVEHFQAYASGVYSVREAVAFTQGHEVCLYQGSLWKTDGWKAAQPFIDNFLMYAAHIDRILASLQLFVAPLVAEERIRRRIESALVTAFYALPETARGLFPPGFPTWRRRRNDQPLQVVCATPPPIVGFPPSFDA